VPRRRAGFIQTDQMIGCEPAGLAPTTMSSLGPGSKNSRIELDIAPAPNTALKPVTVAE